MAFLLLILLPGAAAPAAPATGEPPAGGAPAPPAGNVAGGAKTIELHAGIPGVAYIGQPLADVLKKFPDAEVAPFAGQEDATTVKVPAAGISCIVVGAPDHMKVASVGFNLEGTYEGIGEGGFRTREGIGKGSTVNDLLGAYGPPAEQVTERPRGTAPRADAKNDPSLPQKYQYASDGGAVRTYFSVENYRVTRIVINDLAPLEQHIVKGRPKK
ncbi:MAG: hypothetical protein HYS34_09215 [Acidobacteria bacterium]|nr:hypothetical protein [Acidobacteriota bacterium]